MARAPDLIMVVRHGARLDAADPSWHLHSPTPYDSPLTFGGWNQTKLLGQRIANILKSGKYATGRMGRVRIVMHSSPFLRCLQTSIGIAAGIAETLPDGSIAGKVDGSGPFANDGLPSITEPLDENDSSEQLVSFPLIERPLLRVDAFLGEWLSPDYFDQITPPPDTPLMLLSAKAELLDEAIEEDNITFQQPPLGNFPGGWSGIGEALGRQRSNSFSQGTHADSNPSQPHLAPPTEARHSIGYYSPPVPTSAVSITDHIPQGYVAHARDTCLDVDMAWDSSKEPLDWGDGGQLGEEWGDLHRRFRRGLKSLLSWYQSPCETDYVPTTPLAENDLLVVILVTHSSGCNALIGSLTNQPVLIDVGQASLTIATKIPNSPNQYEVGVKASTDHLRRKSLTKTMPPKTGETKTPPSTTATRHARSSSKTRRSSQTIPVRTTSSDGQQQFTGLWGKGAAPEQSSPPRMWNAEKSGNTNQQMPQPVLATDIDSEVGAPKMWSEPRGPVKRRWTTNEPNL